MYTAVTEANRENRIKIIGFDGMPDGKKAIKKGQICKTHSAFTDKMMSCRLIRKYENGVDFSRNIQLLFTLKKTL